MRGGGGGGGVDECWGSRCMLINLISLLVSRTSVVQYVPSMCDIFSRSLQRILPESGGIPGKYETSVLELWKSNPTYGK